MSYYHVTGVINGRRYYYPTSDYELAVKLFIANGFNSIWSVDADGKRKLIKRK